MTEQRDRVDLNLVQVLASALAAVSSAVLLSTVGVAGTIIGAAVGSVAFTVGSAVYSYTIRVSRGRVAAAQAAALGRVQRARRTGRSDELEQAEAELEKAQAAPRTSVREALANLPWKHVGLAAGGVFVAAMVAIVAFELVAGRSVSSITGGTGGNSARTSIPGLGDGTAATPTQSPTTTPSSATPTSSSPSATPSSATSSSPTSAPSVAPSEPATPTPTPTPTETAPSPSASVAQPGSTPTDAVTPAG